MNSALSLRLIFTALLLGGYGISCLAIDQPVKETSSPVISPSSFKFVGKSDIRWLWFDVYQATLRTPSGSYQPQQWPLSLELFYKRDIRRDQLLRTTEDEWQRQNIHYKAQWLAVLTTMWPNITSQDRLLLKVDEKGTSHFFYNNTYIGYIDDELFSLAFTAIWLSDNTLKPKVRNQLIGLEL